MTEPIPFPARGAASAQPYSEEALALQFADEHAHDFRYCAAWGQWLAWDSRRWQTDKTLLARDTIRDLCRQAAAQVNDKKAKAELSKAKTSSAVENLARTDRRLAATVEQWDADPWLLNTPGGVVDLRTGKLRPADPADYMTKMAAAAPGGECPTWLKFLGRITNGDEALAAFIQRALGYALTGDTSAHAIFFGYGTGANGKSVLVNTVAAVLGDYHKTSPIETFTASSTDRHPTELAGLRGARLVTAIETEEGRRWAESRIKALTGGDVIAARFMRCDFFEFRPQFKLLIVGNHKPGLRSVDEAIRRRFHLIPFAVTIPPDERDEQLTEKLAAEHGAILSWLIKGCLEWQRIGLAPPPAVTDATAAYLAAEDLIAAWMDDCCEVDTSGWVASSAAYKSFKAWAEREGEPPITRRRFSDRLEARGLHSQRTKYARGFAGLALKIGGGDAGDAWNP